MPGKMKKRILIIDDEESIRSVMTRILGDAGFETYSVAHGKEGLEFLNCSTVDLIILDMNMPTMNGLDFLTEYNKSFPRKVPVLMVSGESDKQQTIAAYRLGAYDFIKKPEHNEVLMKRIENGLKIGEMIKFNEEIKQELLMAKKLQKYLFPENEFHSDTIAINTWAKPLTDIGGDLYDYIPFRDGSIIFFIADVTGHSIGAALFTAIVKMVFRNAIKISEVPGRIVSLMNHELAGNLPIETFVTLFCALYKPDSDELLYANAGHPSPILIRDTEITELQGHDPFLGPIQESIYQTRKVKVSKGDSLILFTDGIIEILDDDENPVGHDLFLEIVYDKAMNPVEKYHALNEMVERTEYEITDDCTQMLLQFK